MTPPRTPSTDRVLLAEEEAQAVLLMRAFEEADPEALVLSRGERQRASKLARDAAFERFLVGRARALLETLEAQVTMLPRLARAVRLRLAPLWVVLPALLFGLGANLLGPEKRINVIANPLSGLLLWNLVVYGLILLSTLRGLLPGSAREARVRPSLGLATRLASWSVHVGRWRAEKEKGHRFAVMAHGTERFLELWTRTARPLLSTRLALAFHSGAAVAVVGAMVGMYVRGLVFEYQASWESTFLHAEQVRGLLGTVLGPASAVSGIALPDVAAIGSGGAENAAEWIHLYAVTTLLFVILPRTLLTLTAAFRIRSLASALAVPTDAAYFHRLLAAEGGQEVHATVLPYSYALSATRADRLKSLLHDILGARARITIDRPTGYGELPGELEDPDAGPAPTDGRILLFNLSQTPESEVHGELVEKLKRRAQRGGFALVLADGSAWRERAGRAPAFEERLAEHRRTWDRVVRDAGLRMVHLELDDAPTDDLVERLEAAIHPPRLAHTAVRS